jgi:protein-S-isoprenylcysteine O-methyltransferase Ste14
MRTWWIFFGVAAHALFAVTVCRLFPYLKGSLWPDGGVLAPWLGGIPWGLADALLATQFGVVHSLLLLPPTRKRLQAAIPSAQYGCFFCAATCVSLLLTIEAWRPSPGLVWRLEGSAATAVTVGFYLSWIALLYSLYLTGLGYQTGFTPWWAWVRGRPAPRRTFEIKGAYRALRHPVYLSFLGLVWFVPVMSYDRATLTAVWTAYIFVGSVLKDRRLVHYVGAPYREYQSRVAGYPFIPFGPLARVRAATTPQPKGGRQTGTVAPSRVATVSAGTTAAGLTALSRP